MISEQELIFEYKVELFCKSYGYSCPNLVYLILSNNENLANVVYLAEDKKIIGKRAISIEEQKLINSLYLRYYNDIKTKINILKMNDSSSPKDFETKIFASQDNIKRLLAKTLSQIYSMTPMEALDKSPNDKNRF